LINTAKNWHSFTEGLRFLSVLLIMIFLFMRKNVQRKLQVKSPKANTYADNRKKTVVNREKSLLFELRKSLRSRIL